MKKTIMTMAASAALIGNASAASLIVDFTHTGSTGGNAGVFTYSSTDIGGTGVSFDITVTAVIPSGGPTITGGDRTSLNSGLGSTVENTGTFLNGVGAVPEVLEFTVSNVTGLASGETLQFAALLSQNSTSLNATQATGFGGTFGNVAADSVTLTSDSTSTSVINQSDAGNLGSILLNTEGGTATTGNTFEHTGSLDFTTSFTIGLTDPAANNAIVIQGFDFVVVPVPEPSSTALLGLGGLALILRRRK